MRKVIVLIFFTAFLATCTKEPNDNIIIRYDRAEDVEIYLNSELKIVKRTCKVSNAIVSKTEFTYGDSIIIEKTIESSGNYFIYTYKMGSNGFCKQSIDSIFFSLNINPLQIDTIDYRFNNGFLEIEKKNSEHRPEYFSYYEGNLTNNSHNYYFTYYDSINKLDIFNFSYSNGIAGPICKNLFKQVQWGVNAGASTVASKSEYKYKLDSEGFVIESVETYFPSHYYSDELFEEDLKYYLTTFKYIKNYVP